MTQFHQVRAHTHKLDENDREFYSPWYTYSVSATDGTLELVQGWDKGTQLRNRPYEFWVVENLTGRYITVHARGVWDAHRIVNAQHPESSFSLV